MDGKNRSNAAVSEHDTNIEVTSLMASLQKIFNSRLFRFAMKRIETPRRLEHIVGVYAGILEARGIREKTISYLLQKAMSKSASRFGFAEESLKEALKDPYTRKAIANILMGIAKFGITRPQKLCAPFMIVWNFTKQCNLRCRHCYANAGPHPAPDELTLSEKLEVLRQLDEAGVAAISFSGGEPLVNKDFWNVAKRAAEMGFYVSVATNGTLITRAVAKRLKEIGVRYVEVSIDSPNPEEHDEFRGIPRAWKRSIEGIRNAKKEGLSVGIAVTVTRVNHRQLPEMMELARNLNADRLIAFNFVPTGRGKEIIEMDLSPDEREAVLSYLYEELTAGKMQVFSTAPMYAIISLKNIDKGGKLTPTHFAELSIPDEYLSAGFALGEFLGGCGAGRIYCSIEHNGDIQPCVFLPIKVGNVLRDGFLNVWYNNEILHELRDRDNYACSHCEYRYICGGCRARAYAYYGSISAPDPSCVFNRDLWNELTEEVEASEQRITAFPVKHTRKPL